MKILIAEDEPKVRDFVKKAVEEAGMTADDVATVDDLLSALRTATSASYDALILDRLLKGMDSLDVLAQIRKAAPQTKILVLSALSEVEDKVKGLSEGADDYLGKPFHVSELIARLRSLTRRSDAQTKDTVLAYEDLKIDLETQRVHRGNKRLDLSAKEFRLLCTLGRHPGKVFSKMDLLDQVWDMNHFPESNVVEVTIAGLRAKVDKGFKTLIHNRRGVGYWLGEA